MVISNLTGKGSNDVKESTVSDNLLQCDSTIDFDHLIFYLLTPIILDSLLRKVC